jgi:hypothetical protein
VTSPVYWHPFLYHIVMRVLYGNGFNDRYQAIADYVMANCSLIELCAGDCFLYRTFLSEKHITYTAADINPVFLRAASRSGINTIPLNVLKDPVPSADIVLMQASLYQFIPHQKMIVDKMLAAARNMVIIAEPVRNLSDSPNPIIAFLAKRGANPGTGNKTARFNAETFIAFIKENYAGRIIESTLTAHGREMLAVLNAEKAGPAIKYDS